jgi:hypothetical protein
MSIRPDERHPEVPERAVRIMAERLARWARSGPPEDYMDAARAVMGSHENGYEIARDLESFHRLLPDAELVEICDSAYSAVLAAVDELVGEWVKAEGVKVPFNMGDKIVRPQIGAISAIHEDTATVSYRFSEGRGFGGCDFEDVVLADASNGSANVAADAGRSA